MSTWPARGMFAIALVGWCGLAFANLLFGELNQDEGWYLYAARLVAEGKLPYRDFAFTQGPMLPLVYGASAPIWLPLGVGGGRAWTAALGLLAAIIAATWAGRLAPPGRKPFASVVAFALIALNVYHSYFTTVVKTYSLCSLFLVLGFFVMTPTGAARVGAGRLFLAGMLFAAAAATRITAGLALAVMGLVLLIGPRETIARGWIPFGLGGAVGLALVFGPFALAAPEAVRFFLFDYHAARDAGEGIKALAFKIGFVSRVLQGYFVALAAAIGLLIARILRTDLSSSTAPSIVRAGWATLALITFVQATAPFPYDDYQVPLFPLFAALLAAEWARIPAFSQARLAVAAAGLAMLISGASAVSSPINQAWMIVGRDRIWWRMREQPALIQLRKVAQRLREAARDEGEFLTQDIYLAVEAGLRVPKGWEMGVFSFYPDWPRERAERLNVVNREILREQLAESPARVAAFSEYAFSIAAPEIVPVSEEERRQWFQLVEQRFTLEDTIAYFGQGNTTLRIYRRRP